MNAERIYRLLLRAYPPAFRAEYGQEMVLVFRDQCRDGDVRALRFWVRVLWDVARSAPALRAEATRTVEVVMKLAAILTVLLGAYGILGAMNEWGAASQHAGTYVLAIVLGVAASLLLLGAGVAILLQNRQAARLALVASLVCFVAARLVFPWMSIFLQLIGFVLPVGFLIALYWPRKSSTLGAASIVLVGLAVPQLCRAHFHSIPATNATGSRPLSCVNTRRTSCFVSTTGKRIERLARTNPDSQPTGISRTSLQRTTPLSITGEGIRGS
ncbi:MAG TPA: hypothetical protein VGU74_01795 [Gemmatimonadales bacterium]|nr:hypothetical protein [Gemmatimonadales bacterium]